MKQKSAVLVTGCSSGIGKEVVRHLLAEEWHVVASMRDAENRAHLFAEEAKMYGERLVIVELDVTSTEDQNRVVNLLQERCPPLYGVVHNAGFGLFGALEELTDEEIRNEFEVNLFSVVNLTRMILPLVRQTQGRIIGISSVLGYTGMPLTSVYCSSKFALEGLFESLYYELAPLGIQVALVEPGGHRTNFRSNAKWAAASGNTSSPYHRFTTSYRQFSERLGSRPPISPANVAKVIARLMTQRHMPLRTRCGRDAKWLFLMQKMLPEVAETAFMRYIYRSLFMR